GGFHSSDFGGFHGGGDFDRSFGSDFGGLREGDYGGGFRSEGLGGGYREGGFGGYDGDRAGGLRDGGYFDTLSRGELGGFLGLPTDGGLHAASGAYRTRGYVSGADRAAAWRGGAIGRVYEG